MTDFAELARAFMRQKIELGEGKVYTDGPAPAPPAPVRQVEGSTPSRGGEPSWMVDAPDIPGPGITVSQIELIGKIDPELEALDLPALVSRIASCEQCELSRDRTNTVPGVGDPNANFVVVGEGPGQNEDEQGEPFVGRAGKLLDDILNAIGLQRSEVYICNIVKCRPPQNRNPKPEEAQACIPYLYRQIELVAPKVILAVGGVAACSLLGIKKSLGQMRNKVHEFRGIPLVVTYHPAALLRNPNWKRSTWDDVRIARRILDSRS